MSKYKSPGLTTAYFVLGIGNFLQRASVPDFDPWSGQMGFVEEVIQFAPILEHLGDVLCEEDNAGVYDYEVSEPAGEFMAEAVAKNISPHEACIYVLKDYLISNRMAEIADADKEARRMYGIALDRSKGIGVKRDTVDQHSPGVKLDDGKVRTGLCVEGFARAIQQVAKVTTFGAQKYTPNGWKSVDNGVERYTDAMYRHLLAEAVGEQTDSESGILHAAHAAWNALARLELMLKNSAAKP